VHLVSSRRRPQVAVAIGGRQLIIGVDPAARRPVEPDIGKTAREVRELYPALAGLDDAALGSVLEHAQVVHFRAGTSLFGEGSPCRQFPLVLEGSIRVAKASEGRELQL